MLPGCSPKPFHWIIPKKHGASWEFPRSMVLSGFTERETAPQKPKEIETTHIKRNRYTCFLGIYRLRGGSHASWGLASGRDKL